MRVVFNASPTMEEYHGLADFIRAGETQDLPETVAKTLKRKFPKAFTVYDASGKEIVEIPKLDKTATAKYDGPVVTVQFLAGGGIGDEYHSIYLDMEAGETATIPQDLADLLLLKFPRNFVEIATPEPSVPSESVPVDLGGEMLHTTHSSDDDEAPEFGIDEDGASDNSDDSGDSIQCIAETASGDQCKRAALPGEAYCATHLKIHGSLEK